MKPLKKVSWVFPAVCVPCTWATPENLWFPWLMSTGHWKFQTSCIWTSLWISARTDSLVSYPLRKPSFLTFTIWTTWLQKLPPNLSCSKTSWVLESPKEWRCLCLRRSLQPKWRSRVSLTGQHLLKWPQSCSKISQQQVFSRLPHFWTSTVIN